jgi:DNA-binding NtrC family response regulator
MVNSIRIPPLRERVDDIPLLAEHFLEREVERTGKEINAVSDELMQMLKQYSFPDNVQELKNIIAFAVINTEGDTLTLNSLSPYIRERLVPGEVAGDFVPMKLSDKVADHVMKTMEYCGGVKKDAARLLDIGPERLEELLEGTGY